MTRFPFVALLSLFLLAGCQYSPDISERTIGYNRSIADSTNSIFLLNILRAAHREPNYFTRNTSDTAISSLTPTITGSPKLGKTVGTTFTTGSTMDASQGAPIIANTFTKAVSTLSATLTGTESNQISLTNLDDQASMNGLLSPLPLQQIANYINQGYSSEQMFLLYVNSIRISREFLALLPEAVTIRCGEKAYAAGAVGKAIQSDIYCAYFFGDALPTVESARATPDGGPPPPPVHYTFGQFGRDTMNPRCFPDSVAQSLPTAATYTASMALPEPMGNAGKGPPSVTFENNPATDEMGYATPLQAHTSFECFHTILRALLALDLSPGSVPPKLLYRLPADAVKTNARFFADLSQQGLDFALVSQPRSGGVEDATVSNPAAGLGPDVFGVCKKPADLALSITPEPSIQRFLKMEESAGADATGSRSIRASTKHTEAPTCMDVIQAAIDEDRRAVAAKELRQSPPPVKEAALQITPRPLDTMIYYLGQSLRGEFDPTAKKTWHQKVTFLTWNDPSSGGELTYEQPIIAIEQGIPPPNSIARTSYGYGTYYSPALCANVTTNPDAATRSRVCSFEHPNHGTAQVLTVLNQLWGLNKTQTAPPIIPTVTLIGR